MSYEPWEHQCRCKLLSFFFYVNEQHLVKIGLFAAELLRIFGFLNGGRLGYGMTS